MQFLDKRKEQIVHFNIIHVVNVHSFQLSFDSHYHCIENYLFIGYYNNLSKSYEITVFWKENITAIWKCAKLQDFPCLIIFVYFLGTK